jgi:hypothetical protein
MGEKSTETPVHGSEEGRAAVVVRCYADPTHTAFRETFERVGGCPYCLHTPEERITALQAKRAAEPRLPLGESG